MDPKVVYNTISLYEFTMILSLTILGVSTKNLYILSIVALLFAKQLPEKLIKFGLLKDNELNIRPKDAENCNMINEGGSAKNNPGFPSGHTTVALIIFTIAFYEYIDKMKGTNITVKNIPIIMYILLFFAIMVPFARVKSHCHTPQQVMGGAVLGIAIGLLFCTVIDRKWLSKYGEFKKGKDKFIKMFV